MTSAVFGEGFGFDGGTRAASLNDEFGVPPFSVLDTRQGYWQDRRRAWLALGIQSELGRGLEPGKGNAREGPELGRDHDLLGLQVTAERQRAYRGANNFSPQSAALSGGWDGHPAAVKAGPALAVKAQASPNNILGSESMATGTSLFDPVLCELVYRWFAPAGGTVLDPFAGGSVRGIVAAYLGHPYIGIDLSARQLEANRAQLGILPAGRPVPEWLEGDSRAVLPTLPDGADLVFSCPPYFDLEVYSDDPADLSAMDWHGFVEAYEAIIEAAVAKLQRGHFAVFVVSEVRGPTGTYRGLVPRTIHAFERAGAAFYNDLVLVNSIGSLPIRAARYMKSNRKVGRTHQNVLVFVKGGEPARGWSYDRAAPDSPQQAFAWGEAPEPEPASIAPPRPGRWLCGTCDKAVPAGAIVRQADGVGRGPCYVCEDVTSWTWEPPVAEGQEGLW